MIPRSKLSLTRMGSPCVRDGRPPGFLHWVRALPRGAAVAGEVRRETVMLYSWCRLADDLQDELGDPRAR